jgi:hypothetical protein
MTFAINPNQRRSGESQKQYKERLREQNAAAKGHQTRMLLPSYKGTYVRAKHGPLGD